MIFKKHFYAVRNLQSLDIFKSCTYTRLLHNYRSHNYPIVYLSNDALVYVSVK